MWKRRYKEPTQRLKREEYKQECLTKFIQLCEENEQWWIESLMLFRKALR